MHPSRRNVAMPQVWRRDTPDATEFLIQMANNPAQHVTVGSAVVIRLTTPRLGTPLCHDHRSLEWTPAHVSVTSSWKGRSQPVHKQRPRRIETAPPKGTTLTTDVPLPQKCGFAPYLEEGHRWYVSFLSPHRSSQTVRTHL